MTYQRIQGEDGGRGGTALLSQVPIPPTLFLFLSPSLFANSIPLTPSFPYFLLLPLPPTPDPSLSFCLFLRQGAGSKQLRDWR